MRRLAWIAADVLCLAGRNKAGWRERAGGRELRGSQRLACPWWEARLGLAKRDGRLTLPDPDGMRVELLEGKSESALPALQRIHSVTVEPGESRGIRFAVYEWAAICGDASKSLSSREMGRTPVM